MMSSTNIDKSRLSAVKPKLVVLDLDNTLWEPELYQLRKLQRNNIFPVAGKDVNLFPVAKQIIEAIQASPEEWSNTKFAVASRTKNGDWARDLLTQFGLNDFFQFIEIFPGDKKKHFQNLKQASGVDYKDMLFFDDNRDGKFGNCLPVSGLGVLSVHCPSGISSTDIWTNAFDKFDEWSNTGKDKSIVEWDGQITKTQEIDETETFIGTISKVFEDQGFGFIRYGGRKTRDMFFHFSSLPETCEYICEGDQVSFNIVMDARKGRTAAKNMKVLTTDDGDEEIVTMRAFSMNMPFAALLSNGYKTLETRNGTMFVPYEEGTKMLLQVGQRNYPDGDRHIEVMKGGGLSDEEITELKTLPKGFGKGMAVAILEIGKTYETTLEERSDPEFERKVGAYGADSGMRATEIRKVEYLKQGVKVKPNGGVFKVKIDKNVIPDGWL